MIPSEFIGKFKSKYLWGNLAAMVAVVVVLCFCVKFGLDIYTHHGESVIVPNLKKKSLDDAMSVLGNLGIEAVVSDTGYVKTLPPGCILEQSLAPGDRVKTGHVMYLVINSSHTPTITLPDIIDNSSLREAMAKLTSMGFKLGQPKFVPGEKDWVYGVMAGGRNVVAGDKISVEDVLTIIVGNGRLSTEDSLSIVDDGYDNYDNFESESDVDNFEEVEPSHESSTHQEISSEKQQREAATSHEQNNGNEPVIRKLN